MKNSAPPTVDAYVAALAPKVRRLVQQVRRAIHKAEPGVDERISYQIPTFTLGGRNLIHIAAFKQHVGVYPVPKGDAAFERAVAPHRSGKATARFPFDEPVPLELIAAMVKLLKRAMLEREARRHPRPKVGTGDR